MVKTSAIQPKRGDIFLVNFDFAIGTEIKKTRPSLIIQNDIANIYSTITIVAAITSQTKAPLYPTEVLINKNEGGLEHESAVVLSQIRSIDKQRLIKYLGTLDPQKMLLVNRALERSFGLIDL